MNVLISGGSGLVGTVLSQLLLQNGHSVSHLSRRSGNKDQIKVYQWDLTKGFIEEGAIENADHIVHLAGTGIADQRWTKARKKSIIDSRVQSAQLLEKYLRNSTHKVQSFVSASGMGYYGDGRNKVLTETDTAGSDFLADVCVKWERASEGIEQMGIRRSILRISLVLSKDGGALPKMALPAKMGLGNYFGNGSQIYSWIQIEDLARMFLFCIEHPQVSGIFNAATPYALSNKEFVKVLCKALGRPFIPFPAPAFALKMILGEMSAAVLGSIHISADKIKEAGFNFKYPQLQQALEEIYK